MTFSVNSVRMTFSTTKNKMRHSAQWQALYAECHYSESCYAECCGAQKGLKIFQPKRAEDISADSYGCRVIRHLSFFTHVWEAAGSVGSPPLR
jgi:hypothetical protein